MPFKRNLRKYFEYSAKEKRGIVILAFILLVLIIVQFIIYNVEPQPNSIAEAAANRAFLPDTHVYDTVITAQQTVIKDSLFTFNPNTLSKDLWHRLGLSEYAVDNIMKYVASGGRFYQKSDLRKIYGLSLPDYKRLAPYISLHQSNIKRKTFTKIAMNSADSAEWTTLKGIGPVYSNRIVKYRSLLGGFVQKEQLKEVYGIDSTLYSNLEPYLVIKDSAAIRKIDVNKAKSYLMYRHPYIDRTIATGIIEYRERTGEITDIQELLDSNIVDTGVYHKIKPYLKL